MNLQDYIDKIQMARVSVQHHVGDYTLTLDKKWNVFSVSHRQGKPVPKSLEGRWNNVEDFRRAAEKLLGADYSIDALTERKKQAEDALASGRTF